MNSIGSAAGFCQKHQMDKMFVGTENATEPTCVRCIADAIPKIGRTQIAEDPGEEFFKRKDSAAKITALETTHGANANLNQPHIMKATSLDAHVKSALSWLTNAPMPKDLKQFKSLQKVIKILESLVENTNG